MTVTFDGWETQFYGDCLQTGQEYLMHFRTRGSKNGIRRYQETDGTWTELGLRERRIREGFGERNAMRKERKETRRAEKAAARSARNERINAFKAEQAEAKRKKNPKNLTDAELRTGIERLKMEQEYRDLSRSPAIKAAEKFVSAYFNSVAEKQKAENEQKRLRIDGKKADASLTEAKAKLRDAEANKINARKGASKYKNRAEFLKAKDQRSKTTIRGAIGISVGNLIRKEGENLVKEWGNKSIKKRVGRNVSAGIRQGKRLASNMKMNYLYGPNMNSGSGPALN